MWKVAIGDYYGLSTLLVLFITGQSPFVNRKKDRKVMKKFLFTEQIFSYVFSLAVLQNALTWERIIKKLSHGSITTEFELKMILIAAVSFWTNWRTTRIRSTTPKLRHPKNEVWLKCLISSSKLLYQIEQSWSCFVSNHICLLVPVIGFHIGEYWRVDWRVDSYWRVDWRVKKLFKVNSQKKLKF